MSQDGIGYSVSAGTVWVSWFFTLPVRGTEAFQTLANGASSLDSDETGRVTQMDRLIGHIAQACINYSPNSVQHVQAAWGGVFREIGNYFKEGQWSRIAGASLIATTLWISAPSLPFTFLGTTVASLLILRNCYSVRKVLKDVDPEKSTPLFCGGIGVAAAALLYLKHHESSSLFAELILNWFASPMSGLVAGVMTAVWFASKPTTESLGSMSK